MFINLVYDAPLWLKIIEVIMLTWIVFFYSNQVKQAIWRQQLMY